MIINHIVRINKRGKLIIRFIKESGSFAKGIAQRAIEGGQSAKWK